MMMKWLGRAREAESEAKSGRGAPSASAVEKFRRAWFQSQTHVTVEISRERASPPTRSRWISTTRATR